MIADSILKKYGATVTKLKKGEPLFQQGERAVFFYIVRTGKIKMTNYSEQGREFIQGYFTAGQSFGEPPFFTGGAYPASAIAVEESDVWKTSHDQFLKLLKDHFEIQVELLQTLCGRLVYKSTMLSELAIEEAEHRLMTLMRYLAQASAGGDREPFRLTLTRQQLADLTGLRVETVIRAVKSLEQHHRLAIDPDGKIVLPPAESD